MISPYSVITQNKQKHTREKSRPGFKSTTSSTVPAKFSRSCGAFVTTKNLSMDVHGGVNRAKVCHQLDVMARQLSNGGLRQYLIFLDSRN